MIELFPTNLKIDFLAKGRYAIAFSLVLLAVTVYLWVSLGESKYGLDYRGGSEFVVAFQGEKTSEQLRQLLSETDLSGITVQSFEGSKGTFVVRVGDRVGDNGDSKSTKQRVEETFEGAFAGQYEIRRSQYIGPTIGKELREKATIALLIGLIGILIYVSVRFEVAFAIGAVVALFHDVIVATGFYLAAGNELTMGSLAAALTIIGYSVNDTIIIFDRVREEIFKRKEFNLRDLMNQAINATLARTVVTSLLTLFSAFALMVFGGGAIKDLSVFLVAGIITGAYSTVFIASPVALAWHECRMRRLGKASAAVEV